MIGREKAGVSALDEWQSPDLAALPAPEWFARCA